MIGRPPISTLFPYTTLFRFFFARRSQVFLDGNRRRGRVADGGGDLAGELATHVPRREQPGHRGHHPLVGHERSEEHTSELQSLAYLVCRLLLEKKKKTTIQT